jgi:ubiquinone/menaquinone biosynthesis C-methylase UbiE
MDTPAVHDRNADQAAYWNGPAGQRWIGRQETLDIVLAPVSEVLFDRARVAEGERVIDVGCGCGATTFELARRVGSSGRVLGVDISAPMVARARGLAPANLALDFIAADATVHQFEPGRTDLLFSRFGVMFFAEPNVSFANMRKALRRGGRIVFACWREPRKNPWMILPLQEAYKHVPRLPELGPEDPGPFAFANDTRVRRILNAAGFTSIAIQPVELSFDLAVGKGLDGAVEAALSIGPVSRALEGQPPDLHEAVARSIRRALGLVQQGNRVELAGSVWIVTAEMGDGR